MATFFSYLTQHKFPPRSTLHKLLSRPLSWYGIMFYALIASILVVVYIIIITFNSRFLVTIPARGGTLTEGVIGAPHLINPVLAKNETDIALTKLLFNGLVRQNSDGSIAPELAVSFTTSPDQLTYTFTLRDKLEWSDNKALTSGDVVFTVSKLQNPMLYTDPYWQDIAVGAPDAHTVIFTLPQARTDFTTRMTFGILPEHIWNDITDEDFERAAQNLKPVGSGQYKYQRMHIQNGVPQEIILKRNTHYAFRHTYIDRYIVDFFANQDDLLNALNTGSIDMTLDASPATAAATYNDTFIFEHIESPTMVGLFQLQNESAASNKNFLTIMDRSIDKNAVLATVEYGYGVLSSAPVQADTMSREDTFAALQTLGYVYKDGALEKNGSPVGFSIAVENDPSLLYAARALASEFSKFGITVTIKAFDHGTFQDAVQANQYQLYFGNMSKDAIPRGYEATLMLYTKAYPFIHTDSLHIFIPHYLDDPNDRYIQSLDWHIRTNRVWKIFSKNHTTETPISTNN